MGQHCWHLATIWCGGFVFDTAHILQDESMHTCEVVICGWCRLDCKVINQSYQTEQEVENRFLIAVNWKNI